MKSLPLWKYTTIRPKPNTMYQFEKVGHRLGYRKRTYILSDISQYQPYCICKWRSEFWFKVRNEASRREFISHVVAVSTQGSLLTEDETA